MSPSRPHVYLVDDEASIRKALSRLLQTSGYTVTTFALAKEFLALSTIPGPACLLLDLQMPGVNGLELQKALIEVDRQIPIIFISGHSDVSSSVRAMKNGAVDFLTKPFDEQTLLSAIAGAIEKDRAYRKKRSEQQLIQNYAKRLTDRERQVFAQVLTGRLNKQIAVKLGISEKTVKVHRARVMTKMRAGSVVQLVRLSEKINIKEETPTVSSAV